MENNGKLASCDKECAQVLSQFYASVYTVENDATIPFAVPKTTEELMSITFSPYMIAIALSKTNDHSSPGPDNIPYTVLKNGGYHLYVQLSRLSQLCLNEGMVPMK